MENNRKIRVGQVRHCHYSNHSAPYYIIFKVSEAGYHIKYLKTGLEDIWDEEGVQLDHVVM